MLFQSGAFLIFFPIVILLFYLIPQKGQMPFLLAASYYFYMSWNAKYALLLLFSTVLTYSCARLIEKAESAKSRKVFLILCLVLQLGILFGMKYLNFAVSLLARLLLLLHVELTVPAFDIVLPVGISFYTFQALSYVIDVYRKEEPAEKNFLQYALYVSFFPTILSGPIERSKNLLMQIRQQKRLNPEKIVTGLLIMAFGYFQKLIIAGRASVMVDHVYQNPDSSSALQILLAVFLFSIQIYCDFGGYSMLALGAAKVLGFDLTENFRQPYLAVSIQDFWRRWHISLSTWFRDYLYIPLGGSRCSRICKYRNIMITFLVSGMWHGAGLHYLVWGGLNGFFQVCEDAFSTVRRRLPCKRLLTFIVASFTWVFFCAESVSRAVHICLGVCRISGSHMRQLLEMGLGRTDVIVLVIAIAVLIVADLLHEKGISFTAWLLQRKIGVRYVVYLAVCMVLLLQVVADFGQPAASFLYFQF